MILGRPLTAEERRISQRLYGAFSLGNGMSYMCLGENLLVLFAAHLGAPNAAIALLGAMQFVGYAMLPLGVRHTARRGAATSQADFWLARNAAALLTASAALVWRFSQPMSWIVVLAGAFLFYGFRAAGGVLFTPLMGDVSTEDEAPGVIGWTTALFNSSAVATLAVVTAATRRWHGLNALATIIVVGALLGTASSFFLRGMRETGALRDAARAPLWRGMLAAMRDGGLRRLTGAWFLLNLSTIMLVPVSTLALKRGCGFGDSAALLCACSQFAGGIASSFACGALCRRFGPKRALVAGVAGCAAVSAAWTLFPAGTRPGTATASGAAIFFLLGAFFYLIYNAVNSQFLLSCPDKKAQVPASIAVNLAAGMCAGVAGSALGAWLVSRAAAWAQATGMAVFSGAIGPFRLYFLLLLPLFAVAAAGCAILQSGDNPKTTTKRSNGSFTVTWDDSDGTLASLVMSGDPDRMNWIEGTDRWGAIRLHRMDIDFSNGTDTWGDTTRMAFAGMRDEGNAVISTYRLGPIRADVRREVTAEGLEESYVFTNEASYPVYFLRGHLGILATFNDSYAPASVSETQRCHAHIWCGGENSWVRALKMGPYPTELALVLQEGDLDAYSVRRIYGEQSNDRGDFVLHPAPFHLNPGASKTIAWKVVAYPAGKFDETLLRNGGVKIDFRQETVFPGETFEIEVTGPDGKTIRHSRKPGHGVGEYDFEFDVGGRKAKARGFCSPDFDDLVSARVRFIVERQQCLEPDSPLHGAYLIWDSEDGAPYFDYLWRDHNACRERVVMALTVARWLRRHTDPDVMRSIELFERFVLREFFDGETCTVYDTIGKDPKYKRLYNAPNLVQFWRELYGLKGDARYLDYIEKSLLDYYRLGGDRFYPNGCDFSSELALLEGEGRKVPELREAVGRHVANIVANGIHYPEHEVRFEQTIATPAVSILAQYCRLVEKTPAVLEALEANFDILSRFQGNQPDHRLHETAIRHWDGYWFGKRHLYGDTLHQHSTITARAFLQYAAATGDSHPVKRAERCLRNCLCMFRPDGTATCAQLLPLTVTMINRDGTVFRSARRGEFADPFVNDMDVVLYLGMRSGLFGEYGKDNQ